MIKHLLPLLIFIIPPLLTAQTDSVSNKISKIPYKHVDVLAKFPQGDFKSYISNNLKTNHTFEYSVNGQIILLMTIGADGGISQVTILKSLSPKIDPEVVRVVNASPKWQPATLNGQKVSMDMVLNIDIAITGTKKPAEPAKLSKVVMANVATPIYGTAKAPAAKAPVTLPPPVPKKTEPIPVKKPPVIIKTIPPAVAQKANPPVIKKTPPIIIGKKSVLPVVKPAPVIAKKITSPVIKKTPPPVIAKKVTPPVAKKPAPSIAKPAPVIAKKAEPPFVKKAPPVIAKKVEPPVIKKSLPPVVKPPAVAAKKPVPPAIKKPAPVVAKKIEKPSVKKPNPPAVKEPALASKPAPVKKRKRVVIKQDLFNPTGDNAQFIGGDKALARYLGENISYPDKAKKAGIEGRVVLSFVVEEDGTVDDVEVISSPSDDLSQEAIRVMLASPKWKPGQQNGIAVPVSFIIPIKFTLSNKTTN